MTSIKNDQTSVLPTQAFIFNATNQTIHTQIIDHEPWFAAKDVCDALGIVNNRDAVSRLDDDEKRGSAVPTPSGIRTMTLVNESGLYNLIFQSRKPEAKAFRKWVTSEVLPRLRRTGRYDMSVTKRRQDFIDLRCEPYTTQQLGGYSVRTIQHDDAAWYSVADILRAIQVGTGVRQCVNQLNIQREMAKKIFIFGNTHPSWFTTITGLRLIVSSSRKLRSLGHNSLALQEGGAL